MKLFVFEGIRSDILTSYSNNKSFGLMISSPILQSTVYTECCNCTKKVSFLLLLNYWRTFVTPPKCISEWGQYYAWVCFMVLRNYAHWGKHKCNRNQWRMTVTQRMNHTVVITAVHTKDKCGKRGSAKYSTYKKVFEESYMSLKRMCAFTWCHRALFFSFNIKKRVTHYRILG